MLQIRALQQQQHRQSPWGLPCLGGTLVVGKRQQALVCRLENDSCNGRSVNWKQSSRSSRAIYNALRRRRNGIGSVAVMGNSDVERSTEAFELESLVVGEPGLQRSPTLNSKINNVSKWVVVGLVATGVLWRHDDHAVWFCVGSALNGGFCKLLKYFINENRPRTADGVKEDPGMPSSHAQGFFYVASYTSLAWLLWQGINVWSSMIALGILLSCAYLSWLRISEGLHSVPQVMVGGSLGTVASAFWLYLWKAGVESAMHSSFTAKFMLYMSFVAACAVSYFIYLKQWEFEHPSAGSLSFKT